MKSFLFVGLMATMSYVFFSKHLASFHDSAEIFWTNFGNADFFSFFVPFHGPIKASLLILSGIPLFQTVRLMKTKSAEDVSILYTFFAILSLTCINIDIFRSQFGKSDINFFIIFCRYNKIILYNLNLAIIFYFMGRKTKQDIIALSAFFMAQVIITIGFYAFPGSLFKVIGHRAFGPIIGIIFVIGIYRPLLQIFKTLQKGTANNVSIMYYATFTLFLLMAMLDSFVVLQTSNMPVPVKTNSANSVKTVLYIATMTFAIYFRYFRRPKK